MLAVKQQQSADAEFDGHGDPHAAQAERGDEKHRETEADDPDAAKVQKARHKRIARSTEGSGGNDGSAEKRLGEQFDAEHLGGKRADLRVRSQNAEDERTEDHHQSASDGHQDCTHGNADIAVAFRQLVISGAVASADERCRGGADAVAWHVAEAFSGDGERIGRNRNGAERGNQHGGSNHGAVHRDFLHSNRHTDFECSFQDFHIENRFFLPAETQPRIADTTEPGTREADDGAGQHRSHAGTHDTENRNQKSIENDIEHAHDGI